MADVCSFQRSSKCPSRMPSSRSCLLARQLKGTRTFRRRLSIWLQGCYWRDTEALLRRCGQLRIKMRLSSRIKSMRVFSWISNPTIHKLHMHSIMRCSNFVNRTCHLLPGYRLYTLECDEPKFLSDRTAILPFLLVLDRWFVNRNLSSRDTCTEFSSL